jgi:ABC-type multidrug transport system ATPase subunit
LVEAPCPSNCVGQVTLPNVREEAPPQVLAAGREAIEAGRTPSVLRARDLVFRYGRAAPVVNHLDLDVGVGEIVGIVGTTGAGTSTLLRIFAGELRPESGTLELPARHSSGGRVMLGFAPSSGPHYSLLTGRQNAEFFARAAGLRRSEAHASVAEYMSLLGLEDVADRPVAEYSFSARRRLLLVEALAHRPALTILDRPFEGLDQPEREVLIHALRLLSAKRGTVVVASQELGLLPELADRILFLHEGRVATGGRVAELLATVGSATRIEVELERRPPRLDVRFRPGIRMIDDGDPIVLESSRGHASVGEACGALIAAGALIRSVTVREVDLAEVFRRATGTELGL